MANYALFMGWNRAVPGREAMALECFSSFMGYWAKQQKDGKIESFEPVVLEEHGGDFNGFCIVRGDRAKIDAIRATEDFQKLWSQAVWSVNNVGILNAEINDALQQRMARIAQLVQQYGTK